MYTNVTFDHAMDMIEQIEQDRIKVIMLRYDHYCHLRAQADIIFYDINQAIKLAHGEIDIEDVYEVII